ncbi:MAG: hypothetical protein MJZ06_01710 [Bacteroidaceae bacterium]|nr:hypothetical protein [Bacteroidaceae bacterium]
MEQDSVEKYGLDLHCTMMLEEYRENRKSFEKILEISLGCIRDLLAKNGILVTAVEGRVKEEKSLAGKLELKGHKYRCLSDITDIIGTRVITFYTDDVDKVAALAENSFEIDWENSVDKRKMHQLDSFGYMSLHYVCRIPKSMYFDPEHPEINTIRFEIQLRTTLQHMWANMNHDCGYKGDVEIPIEHLRNMNRLAGVLELADDEFSRIRTAVNDYRRQVQNLVASGKFSEVALDIDTFRSYLNMKPFDKLNRRIAAINQAEIHDASLMPYLALFKYLGFKTLGDIEELKKSSSDDAYQLATLEIGGTDIDIISSTVAVQDLCIVHILKSGAGEQGLTDFFDQLNGQSAYNRTRAARLMEKTSRLAFMNK